MSLAQNIRRFSKCQLTWKVWTFIESPGRECIVWHPMSVRWCCGSFVTVCDKVVRFTFTLALMITDWELIDWTFPSLGQPEFLYQCVCGGGVCCTQKEVSPPPILVDATVVAFMSVAKQIFSSKPSCKMVLIDFYIMLSGPSKWETNVTDKINMVDRVKILWPEVVTWKRS